MKTSRTAPLAALALVTLAIVGVHAVAADAGETFAERAAETRAITDAAERAKAHYQLGEWAKEQGLANEARSQFEAALALDTDHEGARQALGFTRVGEGWIGQEEAMRRKGLVLRDGRWILTEEAAVLDAPENERKARVAAHKKVGELLKRYAGSNDTARKYAREALDTIEDDHKLEPLAYALRSPSEAVRSLAAEELGRLGNRRALRPLLHRVVTDTSEDVRFAALDAAKSIGDANLVLPLMRVMEGENAEHRKNAAAAIGRIDDPRGVRYLIYKVEARGGGAPRSYFSSVNQLTFIQDFDVEVASTAFIADPQVGVIQDGIVLDAQIIATSEESWYVEREVIHRSLVRLTGAEDVENTDGAWAKWWNENKERYAKSE